MKREIKCICPTCEIEFIYKSGLYSYNKSLNHFCSFTCAHVKHGMNTRKGKLDKTNSRYDLWLHAKRRCKKSDREFDILPTDIPEIPKYCPILGIELIRSDSGPSYNSPSLDRIDSTKGYIKGNIRIISHRANRIKNDATFEEIEMIYNDFKKLNEN